MFRYIESSLNHPQRRNEQRGEKGGNHFTIEHVTHDKWCVALALHGTLLDRF